MQGRRGGEVAITIAFGVVCTGGLASAQQQQQQLTGRGGDVLRESVFPHRSYLPTGARAAVRVESRTASACDLACISLPAFGAAVRGLRRQLVIGEPRRQRQCIVARLAAAT